MDDRFVKEAEVEEAKKKRQEEWDRVRKPEDPEEAPEAPIDRRPLWARLQEQKEKKDADKQEEHALKNSIRGLEEEECKFLEFVDTEKQKRKRELEMEEKNLLEEMKEKAAKATLEMQQQATTSATVVKSVAKSNNPKVNKQAALLGAAIKRKSNASNDNGPQTEKRRVPDADESTTADSKHSNGVINVSSVKQPSLIVASGTIPTCIQVAGYLPSLVGYGGGVSDNDASTSESDSDSSDGGDQVNGSDKMKSSSGDKSQKQSGQEKQSSGQSGGGGGSGKCEGGCEHK